MSRWSLLKSAIVAGKRDSESDASIHHFKGYTLLQKKKVVWRGFTLDACLETEKVDSTETLRDIILTFLQEVDTCECIVRLTFASLLCESIIKNGLVQHLWELLSESKQDNTTEVILKATHTLLIPKMKLSEYTKHQIAADNLPSPIDVYTREKPKESGLTAKALLSNKLHNVDNTGNICVWPSESILLFTLLTNPKYLHHIQQAKRVLELGGGLTALAGLGLAASGLCSADIVSTDGHPDCVANQKVCIHMNRQMGAIPADYSIKSHMLHWSKTQNSADVIELTEGKTRLFDVIIASDCLFFRDFHEDLIQTILSLLSPNGVVLLLQPPRDGTLNQFRSKCEPFFDVEMDDDYCSKLSALRREYLSASTSNTNQQTVVNTHSYISTSGESGASSVIQDGIATTGAATLPQSLQRVLNGYNEDIHYPVMMKLTRKKEKGSVLKFCSVFIL